MLYCLCLTDVFMKYIYIKSNRKSFKYKVIRILYINRIKKYKNILLAAFRSFSYVVPLHFHCRAKNGE